MLWFVALLTQLVITRFKSTLQVVLSWYIVPSDCTGWWLLQVVFYLTTIAQVSRHNCSLHKFAKKWVHHQAGQYSNNDFDDCFQFIRTSDWLNHLCQALSLILHYAHSIGTIISGDNIPRGSLTRTHPAFFLAKLTYPEKLIGWFCNLFDFYSKNY